MAVAAANADQTSARRTVMYGAFFCLQRTKKAPPETGRRKGINLLKALLAELQYEINIFFQMSQRELLSKSRKGDVYAD